jgi:hypothetical protein
MGRPIEAYLPTGEERLAWRALINEVQMPFHGAEINRERETRGDPTINGLWLSGAGILPTAGSMHTEVTTVWSNDPLAIGLGQLAGLEIKPTPQSLDIILAGSDCGRHLVVLESMLAPASYDDFPAWSGTLAALEDPWFKPIDRAVTMGELGQCYVYDCAGQRFSLNRACRWRVWCPKKPLHVYVPDL